MQVERQPVSRVAFSIPADLLVRLRQAIPQGERSARVTAVVETLVTLAEAEQREAS